MIFCTSNTKRVKMILLIAKENNIEMFTLKLKIEIENVIMFSFNKTKVRRTCKIMEGI